MLQLSEKEVKTRLQFDNPWWMDCGATPYNDFLPRSYLDAFCELIGQENVNRAIVLMGPRRVGKTVMVHHAIRKIIDSGLDTGKILYASLDTPIFTGLSLEKILAIFQEMHELKRDSNLYVFFDEIQYLKNWEVHLKSLVDSYPNYKFIATGSAAAALRLKSNESGAGRFTEFMLPPLTFAEFLLFAGIEDQLIISNISENKDLIEYKSTDIELLNKQFINYLNYGGYPEAVVIDEVQADAARYIKRDIIDKVLLRDLPSLYGIDDIQDLNRLFTVLAYNTGNEVSIDELSKSSGIAKNTIRKYMEYLEAAFLIRRVHRVDRTSKKYKRITNFKVYLTNPSMRAALFGPVYEDDISIGHLTETAIFSQWLHSDFIEQIFYSRWKNGEVDIVALDKLENKPYWAVEVKWSDLCYKYPGKLKSLYDFVKDKNLDEGVLITTLTKTGFKTFHGVKLEFRPSSLYCYTVGKNVVKNVAYMIKIQDLANSDIDMEVGSSNSTD